MGATLCGAMLVAAVAPSTQALAALALLEPSVPTVAVQRAGGPYSMATDSLALRTGDGVRTDATGRALITYADGTTLAVAPESELVIETLQPNGRDLLVLVHQTAGRVWYQLSRSLSPSARYEVRSGALAAVVRAGSTVEVAVGQDGTTSVTTLEGAADTRVNGYEVTVTAGTTTTVTAGASPTPPVPADLTVAPPAPIAGPVAAASPTPLPAPSLAPSSSGGGLPAVGLPTLLPGSKPANTTVAQPPAPAVSDPTVTSDKDKKDKKYEDRDKQSNHPTNNGRGQTRRNDR